MTFKILGLTDERTTCECCGKVNLKCTVALEHVDAEGHGTGNITYYGRDCASRAKFGRTSPALVKKIEAAANSEMYNAKMNREAKLARIADDRNNANRLYHRTGRSIPGSYFAARGGQVVRVDGGDAADVAFYSSEGFVQCTAAVAA